MLRILTRTLCVTFFLFSMNPYAHAGRDNGSPASQPGEQIQDLGEGWQFRQAASAKGEAAAWLPAKVPGDVHLDLLANHLIPDPFYRENEAKVQWVEAATWEYRKQLTLTAQQLTAQHLELVFHGLDTTAEVSLNGHALLSANNMFRTWRVDAKPFLHAGSNELHIDFLPSAEASASLQHADTAESEQHIPAKAYLRRAAYEYGWDWGPRLVTSGLWRPVQLDLWTGARIEDLYVQQQDITAASAHLNVNTRVIADREQTAQLTLDYGLRGGEQRQDKRSVTLHPGVNEISMPVQMTHPQLWYPAGYGGQPMYTFHATLQGEGGLASDRGVATGLRSIQLERKRDPWGRSFSFVVNGIPVFIKGADVIPFDSFSPRVTEGNYDRILRSARDAHMNMIRLWGGGYYETDEFYTLCDELGLMVWQDFMYASSWYPGTVDFKQNMEQEAVEQVERLRNHPSMALWCGNNEVESVLNAFLGGQSEKGRLGIWKTYLTEFSGILPRTVARLEPDVPYWPSSPSADYEETSDTFQSGDAHDWSIWHGREPFENYNLRTYRFNSEYGFQSFPDLKTVETYTAPEDRASIFTPVMLAHQKNNEGNAIIHEYMLRDYAEPKDFASFLYVSQVLQAEGVKIGAEHMRRTRPSTMGSIFWQLNDCWPVASWSSIDYLGHWKALMYYARRFYNPVLVSPTVADGKLQVFAVSDQVREQDAELSVRLLSFTGKELLTETHPVKLAALSSSLVFEKTLQSLSGDGAPLNEQFVVTELRVNHEVVSSNILYLEPVKQVRLPRVQVAHTITGDRSPYTLSLSAPALTRDVYITTGDLNVSVSDNFVDLVPGETVKVQLETQATRTELEHALQLTSLVDAFPAAAQGTSAPATAAQPAP